MKSVQCGLRFLDLTTYVEENVIYRQRETKTIVGNSKWFHVKCSFLGQMSSQQCTSRSVTQHRATDQTKLVAHDCS